MAHLRRPCCASPTRRRVGNLLVVVLAVVTAATTAAAWVQPPSPSTVPHHHRQQQPRQQRRGSIKNGIFGFDSTCSNINGATGTQPRQLQGYGPRRTSSSWSSRSSLFAADESSTINGQEDDPGSSRSSNEDSYKNEGDSRFRQFASSLLNDEEDGFGSSSTTTKTKRNGSDKSTTETWKRDLDELLNVSTPNSRRQMLLQRLLNSNQDIRSSVEQALKDRTIDPLLTPQTKKIQDGTRAVARQVTSDILPSLAQRAQQQQQQQRSSSTSSTNSWFPTPPLPPPLVSLGSVEAAVADLSKVGDRFFSLAQRQFQRGLDEISRDLADPSRIPDRVTQQASDLVKETLNVFAETPVNLKEPSYRIVMTTDDYEIRDYDGYRVASTRGMSSSADSWAQDGASFATLASYVLGGNEESRVLEMTTPVTTTMTGEMRFYLAIPEAVEAPQPTATSTSASAAVEIQTLPPARLAIRKFPGFVTDGEVSRQKSALLTALELDGIELDVKHGQTVPHVIFQYNPPYTVPVLRRNEIAVPVVGPSDQVEAELRKGESALGDDFWSGVAE